MADRTRPQLEPALLGPAPRQKSRWRLAILALGLTALAAIAYFSPARGFLQEPGRIKVAVAELGFAAYPVTVLAAALLVCIGVPRLLICGLGAMIFGFTKGLLLTQAGTLLGYYCIFLFIRWGGGHLALARYPKIRSYADLIKNQGVMGVILARQMPMHCMLINICLGMSGVKQRHFLLGTAIGLFPEAIPVALIGAGVLKGDAAATVKYLTLGAVAFVVIWLVSHKLLKKRPAE